MFWFSWLVAVSLGFRCERFGGWLEVLLCGLCYCGWYNMLSFGFL